MPTRGYGSCCCRTPDDEWVEPLPLFHPRTDTDDWSRIGHDHKFDASSESWSWSPKAALRFSEFHGHYCRRTPGRRASTDWRWDCVQPADSVQHRRRASWDSTAAGFGPREIPCSWLLEDHRTRTLDRMRGSAISRIEEWIVMGALPLIDQLGPSAAKWLAFLTKTPLRH